VLTLAPTDVGALCNYGALLYEVLSLYVSFICAFLCCTMLHCCTRCGRRRACLNTFTSLNPKP
jgi:hypothetical protein